MVDKSGGKKLIVAGFVLAAVALFFFIAFSELDGWLKAAFMLAELFFTGLALNRLTGVECHYGLLVLRGFAGFDVMHSIAKKHGQLCKDVSDFGFSLGFGLPASFLAYGRKDKRKFVLHAAGVSLFLALLYYTGILASLARFAPYGDTAFLIAGLLLGLFGLGFLGITLHAYSVLTVPYTPPGVTLLIPGVTVPWEAVFAIVILAVVHELAHGIVASAEKLKPDSSGAVLFGFLPVGAFVEINEKRLDKASLVKKRRIIVAGSTANALSFIVFLAVTFVLASAMPAMVAGVAVSAVSANSSALGAVAGGEMIVSVNGSAVNSVRDLTPFLGVTSPLPVETSTGVKELAFYDVVVHKVKKDYPAYGVLSEGERLDSVDGVTVRSLEAVGKKLAGKAEGERVVLETSGGRKEVVLGKDGKIGVNLALAPALSFSDVAKPGFAVPYGVFSFLLVVFSLTTTLNLILAIINLLPLYITDGQKIIFYELSAVIGRKKAAQASFLLLLLTLAILAINAAPWFFS